MKKLFATLIVIVMVLALTVCLCACGGGNEPQQPQGPQEPQEQDPPVSQEITFDDNVTSSQEVVTVAKQEMSKRYESDTKSLTAEQKSFVEIIYLTIENQLENITGDVENAKTQCNALYKQLIDAVATVKKAQDDFNGYVAKATEQLDAIYNSLKTTVKDVTLPYVTSLYNTAKQAIQSATATDYKTVIAQAINTFQSECKKYVQTVIDEQLATVLKNAIAKIEGIYSGVIGTISSNEVKTSLTAIYEQAILKLSAIIDKTNAEKLVAEAVQTFNTTFYQYAKDKIELTIDEYKLVLKKIVAELESQPLAKLEDSTLINEWKSFCTQKINEINELVTTEKAKQTENTLETFLLDKIKDILAKQVQKYISLGLDQLETATSSLIAKIEDQELKNTLSNYVTEQQKLLQAIDSIDSAKATAQQIVENSKVTAQQIAVQQIQKWAAVLESQLDDYVNNALAKIEDQQLKTSLSTLYNNQKQAMKQITDLDSAKSQLEVIKQNFINSLSEILTQQIAKWCTTIETNLDQIVANALNKIEKTSLKNELTSYYNQQKALIKQITDIDSAKSTLETIKQNTVNTVASIARQQIAEWTSSAKTQLDELVNGRLAKIEDSELKKTLSDFYGEQCKVLATIDDIDTAKQAVETIKTNVKNTVEQIVKQQIGKYIDVAKTTLNDAKNTVLSKITKQSLANELDSLYNQTISQLETITSIDTAKTALNNIVENFKQSATEILQQEIADLIAQAKTRLKTYFDAVNANVNQENKSKVAELYNKYVSDIDNLKDIDKAEEILDQIYSDFVAAVKSYVTEALKNIVSNAMTTIKTKFDDVMQYINLDEYISKFNKLYSDVQDALNGLQNILTAASDATTAANNFVQACETLYEEYLPVWLQYVKTTYTAKGEAFVNSAYEREAYTSLGAVKKLGVKTAVNELLVKYKAAIDALPVGIGAQTLAEEAYQTLLVAGVNILIAED